MRTLLFGLILGAAAGVLYAPATGNRTRALLRDKFVKYSNETTDLVESKSTHLKNKMEGVKAQVSTKMDEVKDKASKLQEQVQSQVNQVRDQVQNQVNEIRESA